MTQVALAWTLLAGGGLLLRSYASLSTTSPGYDVAQVLTFQLRPGGPPPSSPLLDPRDVPRMLAEYDRLAESIGALPGVTAVGYSQFLPMTRTLSVVGLRMSADPPRPPPGQNAPSPPVFGARLPPNQPNVRAVSAGFLDALGMKIVAGRGLRDTEDALAPKVMLINRTLAESGFLWDDPIGRQIYAVGRQPRTIVGIVEDVRRFGLDQEPDPQIFMDFRQAPELLFGGPPMYVAVRTLGDPAMLAPAILKSIRQTDPRMTMDRVATTSQLMSGALSRSRLYAALLSAFAVVALAVSVGRLCCARACGRPARPRAWRAPRVGSHTPRHCEAHRGAGAHARGARSRHAVGCGGNQRAPVAALRRRAAGRDELSRCRPGIRRRFLGGRGCAVETRHTGGPVTDTQGTVNRRWACLVQLHWPDGDACARCEHRRCGDRLTGWSKWTT